MSKCKEIFYVEVTDTFGGEANYSWVRRFKVHANTMRGAMLKVSRLLGARTKRVGDYGDLCRYDFKGSAVCAFVEGYTHQGECFTGVQSI
jgi:hypothetical protein